LIDNWNLAGSNNYGLFQPTSVELAGFVPNGIQVAYIAGTGSFSQELFFPDLSGFIPVTPGATYQLTFQVAPRNDISGTETWTAQLFAGSNALPVTGGTSTGMVVDGSGNGFTPETVVFTAPTSATGDLILKFSGTAASSSPTVFFDTVALSIPEPSTLGIGGVAAAVFTAATFWRRRRTTAAARG
jgi:hypothetical protein